MTFWVAGAVVVGSVVGGIASNSAASKQAGAANNAASLQEQQFQTTNANEAPWRAAGSTALSTIGDLNGTSGNTGAANYGELTHTFDANDLQTNLAPNYQFQLQQGLGATQNAGNAAGFSGNTLQGINNYAQNYAGGAYQQAFNNYTANQTNQYNRLANLAGLGQTANAVTATTGQQAAAAAGNFATSGAAASAAGTVGAANAVSNGLGNYAGWNYLNSSAPSNTGYTNSNPYGAYSDPSSTAPSMGMGDIGVGSYSQGGGYAEGGPVRKYAFGGAVNPIGGYAGWGGPSMMRSAVEPLTPTMAPRSTIQPIASPMPYAAPTRVDGVPQGLQPAPTPYQSPAIGGFGSNQISNFGQPNLMQPAPPMAPPMPRSSILPVGRMGAQAMAYGGPVSGPGGPKSDDVPAMLSNGEHVFDAASVNAMGDGDNDLGQKRLTYIRDMLKMGGTRAGRSLH